MSDYFATRYASATAEVVALLSDYYEGYGVDATGSVEAPTGHVSWVVLTSGVHDVDFSSTTGGYPVGDLVGETARYYGVTADDVFGAWIVTEDDRGHVDVTRYACTDDARDAFRCADARYLAWDHEDVFNPADVFVCPIHGYEQI
jgi:hypothetical protein